MIKQWSKKCQAVLIGCVIVVLGLPDGCLAQTSPSGNGSVGGTVKLVRGQQTVPLSGAMLELMSISGNGGEYQATTDEKGRYAVDLPQGTYKMLLAWMGGECSEIHRAAFELNAGAHLTFDLLVMQCPIIDPIIRGTPIEGGAEKSVRSLQTNPMNIPLTEQTEKYQEQLIPAVQNRWPEILLSFGKYDNRVDEIRYFPLHQIVMNPFAIPNPPIPLILPVTITVDRYTLRASSVILEKGRMVFKASGQVSLSDGTLTTDAASATLSFSDGAPKIEINH